MTYHDAVVVPVLMFAEFHTIAEAADAEVKVTADSASYPDGIRDVAAARVAVIFNTRLSYISPTTIDRQRRVTWFQREGKGVCKWDVHQPSKRYLRKGT